MSEPNKWLQVSQVSREAKRRILFRVVKGLARDEPQTAGAHQAPGFPPHLCLRGSLLYAHTILHTSSPHSPLSRLGKATGKCRSDNTEHISDETFKQANTVLGAKHSSCEDVTGVRVTKRFRGPRAPHRLTRRRARGQIRPPQ
ncbi:hypothetical protein E2C01_064593 [Portunus trituberculatus]|uniref:Uncharacterized protein n=1 Tax=Portunus trituberculatus TaxID=210409 RepID=A0A5B7HKS6_PORTR|nr:hypothetical protein [Portunus trituberculatus]